VAEKFILKCKKQSAAKHRFRIEENKNKILIDKWLINIY
jgi:hypothetical protein